MTSLQETAQDFEREWWGDCTNSFGEEAKQITYAHRMGLVNEPQDGRWPVYDLKGRSVLDLGGGPVSMLLKCVNVGCAVVVDPCPYPGWTFQRYYDADIKAIRSTAEDFDGEIPGGVCESVGCGSGKRWEHPGTWDEAWIYNVLQHVVSPQAVIETAKRHASVLRIFDWLETPPSEGHPHTLHADELNAWIGGTGTVEHVNENGAVGLAYYGCFTL